MEVENQDLQREAAHLRAQIRKAIMKAEDEGAKVCDPGGGEAGDEGSGDGGDGGAKVCMRPTPLLAFVNTLHAHCCESIASLV